MILEAFYVAAYLWLTLAMLLLLAATIALPVAALLNWWGSR